MLHYMDIKAKTTKKLNKLEIRVIRELAKTGSVIANEIDEERRQLVNDCLDTRWLTPERLDEIMKLAETGSLIAGEENWHQKQLVATCLALGAKDARKRERELGSITDDHGHRAKRSRHASKLR